MLDFYIQYEQIIFCGIKRFSCYIWLYVCFNSDFYFYFQCLPTGACQILPITIGRNDKLIIGELFVIMPIGPFTERGRPNSHRKISTPTSALISSMHLLVSARMIPSRPLTNIKISKKVRNCDFSDGSGTQNPGFVFCKCRGENGLK